MGTPALSTGLRETRLLLARISRMCSNVAGYVRNLDGAKAPAATTLVGGCAIACVLVCCAVAAGAGGRRRLAALEKEIQRQVELRNAEHAGRMKAEKELRAFFTSRMVADGGLIFAPIATVHSCFTECVGTPRQGQFAPSTRALLVFDKGSVSPVSLDGVEEFSHVWVFWAFHLNTNQKDARAHAGMRPDSRGHTFPAKVSPPFLKRRVGVFSTRTPHRPNPLGVSLCKVEEVDAAERSIKLSGVDLVDGTPVLDIKPYVPDYDRPRMRDGPASGGTGDGDDGIRVAAWVEASVKHRRAVEWAPDAEVQLEEACSDRRRKGDGPRMRFFSGDHEGVKMAITESLSVDVRSIRKTREAVAAPSCVLLFDGLRVEFATTVSLSIATEASSTPSSSRSGGSAAAATSAVEGLGGGLCVSPRCDDRGVTDGGRSSSPPPPVSVETIRVLSVKVDGKSPL